MVSVQSEIEKNMKDVYAHKPDRWPSYADRTKKVVFLVRVVTETIAPRGVSVTTRTINQGLLVRSG